jgi:large subunit ribosomal protein L24e
MRCSFCGKAVPKGSGKVLVRNSGQILQFCNSKCDRNFGMGRAGKDVRWTEAFRKFREKEGKK